MAFAFVLPAFGAAHAAEPDLDAGRDIYRSFCASCHKWHGAGGGGYGGAALSLRETQLEHEHIVDAIRCGRPGTNMPHFLRRAYDEGECFGLTAEDLGDMMPPRPRTFLRPAQMPVVADYVVHSLQGAGEPTLEECVTFWGENARQCAALARAADAD